ncbi:MAG: sigma-54-dependent Fis family transcriptional regulator [Planctomycetota bacterium]|nr:MAG: sigma-54-dependent Fis family transcriptional regulator [Planctomycetota bacterium]
MGTILVVDDDRAIRHLMTQAFADSDHTIVAVEDAESALQAIQDHRPDVVHLDIELPEMSGFEAFSKIRALDPKLPVIYITGGGTSDTAIQAMKQGAFDYLLKPLDLRTVCELTERAIQMRRLMSVPVSMDDAVVPVDQGDQIVGRSPQMQEVFKAIGRVAPQRVTVLIRGESGTGKELIARAIYQHSDRADGPFLAVNCAAIPEQLLESELFGHEKGAFTGADRQRIGKFEQCNGGTLFLDEIGDMPATLQSKILRLLQQREFQRVGGNETIQTDVRIIAATNRDLEQMVAGGEFREDLLYRLNGYTIELPPLRERGDDLILLIQHFLARIGAEVGRTVEGIAPDALQALKSYSWPGNIRELEAVIRRTLLQSAGPIVAAHDLPEFIRSPDSRASAVRDNSVFQATDEDEQSSLPTDLRHFVHSRLDAGTSDLYAETLEVMERYLLTEVLSRTEGNQSEAARILGITRGSLRNKIRSLGIKIATTVDAD